MKVRNGFVSNSSSSSFVCDVCGNVQSGYDMSLREAEMFECVAGHTFCADHMVSASIYHEECDNGTISSDRYDVPFVHCPICAMSILPISDMLSYLLKKNDTNQAKVTSEIRSNFKDYGKFSEYIKK